MLGTYSVGLLPRRVDMIFYFLTYFFLRMGKSEKIEEIIQSYHYLSYDR